MRSEVSSHSIAPLWFRCSFRFPIAAADGSVKRLCAKLRSKQQNDGAAALAAPLGLRFSPLLPLLW